MSEEVRAYVVRQGDYLVKIAHAQGFDAEAVWEHEKNAALRELRGNHHILAPGDVLFFPVTPKEELTICEGVDNSYTASVPMIEVVLAFQRSPGEALANEPCEIEGLGGGAVGRPRKEVTDGEGKLTLEVPVIVREIAVHFPGQNVTYAVGIGEMDPVTEASGIEKRLSNLGHGEEDLEMALDPDHCSTLALRRFQQVNGLEATGVLDDATRAALEKGHGL